MSVLGRKTLSVASCQSIFFSVAAIATLIAVISLLAYPVDNFVSVKSDPPPRIRRDKSTNNRLTIWSILRDLKTRNSSDFDQTAWLEQLHTFNSINSWLALGKRVDVILYGDKVSCDIVTEFAPSERLRCAPIPCIHPVYKIPQYDCMFTGAAEMANSEFIMYTNSDMLYFDDLLHALDKVKSEYSSFLIVGQRVDILYTQKIDFSDENWRKNMRDYIAKYGVKHGRYGVDFFLHVTAETKKMPPFLVGRVRWDNWLLARFIGEMDTVTVDATEVVSAIHLNHMKVGGSHLRTGTEYNVELATKDVVDPKKIGDITSTDLVLTPKSATAPHDPEMGGCPNCVFNKREQSLDVMLYKHAIDYNIIIASVNHGYIDFALNWVCSLERVGLRNFIFHAVDEAMYNTLSSRGLPVILYESEISRNYRLNTSTTIEGALAYGSVSYQAVMSSRTEFIYRVIQKGYNALLCDVDIIFLRNPFPAFNMSLDIQGGAHKSTKLTGGFLFFRATEQAKLAWGSVFRSHKVIFEQMQHMKKYNPHSMTEQELLNNLLLSPKAKDVKWGTVDEKVIADGKRVFIDKIALKNGEWPAAIHNNYIVGHDNKMERFKNISMWFIDDKMDCRPFPRFLPAPAKLPYSLTIKIFAFAASDSFTRLLNSLVQTDYLGDEVNLDIFVDGIASSTDLENNEALNQKRTLVLAASESFKWAHGEKRVITREQHLGFFGQIVNSWFPQSNSEVALFLQDDAQIVPGYYSILKKALMLYFYDNGHFDPRVFAFNLARQHLVVDPFLFKTKPSDHLRRETLYYKYQLPTAVGAAFFSQHWSQFITWYSDRKAVEGFRPTFSNLVTNEWAYQNGNDRAAFTAWFIRYAAERGIYSIYTNFPNSQSLVTMFPRNEETSNTAFHDPSVVPVRDVIPFVNADLPAGRIIPVYDFHFNRIEEDVSILEDRGLYMDPNLLLH